MIALIDADIVNYRVGYTTDDEPEGIAFARVDEMMDNIVDRTGASEYMAFLTASQDPTQFRKLVYPEYKAKRKQPKPKHYTAIRKYLVDNWDAEIVSGIEADDALGIHQSPDTVICSIDKDLLQVEGRHYNFVKDEWHDIDETEGSRRFYTQMIMGDSTDNIKGIPGKGEKAAMRALDGIDLEKDMFDIVRDMYGIDEEMIMNGQCLWILRTLEDSFQKQFDRLVKLDEA